MKIEYLQQESGPGIAVVTGEEKVITDTQSALDLAMTVKYETGAERIALDKKLVCEDFFILSTGLAGEILQKFVNYHVKAAIYGGCGILSMNPTKGRISSLWIPRKRPSGGWQKRSRKGEMTAWER